jgi:hypothetical protein
MADRPHKLAMPSPLIIIGITIDIATVRGTNGIGAGAIID